MRLLAEWTIKHGDKTRKIELLQGDLANLPQDHKVDLLVVSAFPNDYVPTTTSLIGALHRVGVSVQNLAKNKQCDLRQQYSCWLSGPVDQSFNFRRIICIESGWRGEPPEITDDIYRALAPYLLTDFSDCSIAMPLIGAGDQGCAPDQMLRSILRATADWIERGLPLRLLKIVIYRKDVAQAMADVFVSFWRQRSAATISGQSASHSSPSTLDVFLSYSHNDAEIAEHLLDNLKKSTTSWAIFHDRSCLSAGETWLMKIASALDRARRVVTLYSPSYWESGNCQMEFLAAFTRQVDTRKDVLFPIYLSDANIPYMFRTVQYQDCRVVDRGKVETACLELVALLSKSET